MNEEELLRLWPEPPITTMERLVYLLDAYDDALDFQMALTATSGVYGPGQQTGLTFGDLRAILRKMQA